MRRSTILECMSTPMPSCDCCPVHGLLLEAGRGGSGVFHRKGWSPRQVESIGFFVARVIFVASSCFELLHFFQTDKCLFGWCEHLEINSTLWNHFVYGLCIDQFSLVLVTSKFLQVCNPTHQNFIVACQNDEIFCVMNYGHCCRNRTMIHNQIQ